MAQMKSTVKVVLVVVLVAVVAVSVGFYYMTSSSMTGYAHTGSSQYGQTSSSQFSVNVANRAGLGSYLTNATGFTLYTFMRDVQNSGTSACTGGCSTQWPAFYVANLTLPSGLSASSFTVFTRPDGSKQLAYEGWPLYYFSHDVNPGDTNGQGVLNVWYACTTPTPFSDTTSVATSTTSASGGW